MRYDAHKAPDPQDWLDLDEQERIDQVIENHRRHHLPMGELVKLHGVAHVVVENQIAFGDSPAVPERVARLMGEGLDRHESIHAVGSVVWASSSTLFITRRVRMSATSTSSTPASSPR